MKCFEMSRKFICGVAVPLALMFAACSTDDGSIAGGSAEETGVYAFENIGIEAAAYSASYGSEDGDTLQDGAFVMKGYESGVAWLYELDSVSFAQTGVSYSDTLRQEGDKFKFSNVTLESPYVQVRVFGRSIGGDGGDVSAIADVRKTKNVNLNLLTTLKTALWRYLASKGVAHDSLDARSEVATLEALGIAENFSGFESDAILENPKYVMAATAVSMMFVKSSLIEWYSVDSVKSVLEKDGSLDNLDMKTRGRLVERLAKALVDMKWVTRMNRDVLDSSDLDEDVKTLYNDKQAYVKLVADVYVKLMGEDRCTEAREGNMLELAGTDMFLVCRSEGWRIEVGKVGNVPPESGTMTDARDGRVYRTVTYSIDGKSQTWMAENLKYEYGDSHCLDGKDRQCEVFGRLYSWGDAMGLDSSIVWTMDECLDYYRTELDKCIANTQDEHKGDSAIMDSLCGSAAELPMWCEEETTGLYAKYKLPAAIGLIDSVNHQGVCPQGWHVATADDWKGLFNFIKDTYNVEKIEAAWYLLQSEYSDGPMGFGLQLLPTWTSARTYWVKLGGKRLTTLYVIVPSYATPIYKYDWADSIEVVEYPESFDPRYDLSMEYGHLWNMEKEAYSWYDGEIYGDLYMSSSVDLEWSEKNSPVRCVKN